MSAHDAEAFARLAAEGSDALHRGDDPAAESCLAAALRARPPGHDVDARADLIEARLRLGRHREVVPELRDLVGLYPERERLRRQLAVALCRSGRRAEALAVCSASGGPLLARLRRAIESGEAVPAGRVRGRRVSARARGTAVAALAVAAAAAGLATAGWDGGDPAGDETRAAAEAPVARAAGPIAVARPSASLPFATDGSALWSASPDRRAVVRLGADGRTTRTVPVAGRVDALAAGGGSLWVADAAAGRLLRVSGRTGRTTGTIRLPRGALGRSGGSAVDVSGGTVWATNGGSLVRLDAASGRVETRVELDGPTALVAEAGGAWVGTRSGELVRVRLRGARTAVSRFPGVPGRVVRLVRAHGSLWVARGEPADASVWRYETTPAAIFGTPLRGRFTADLVARPGAVWVRLRSSAYARIDADTSAVELIERESPSAVSPP